MDGFLTVGQPAAVGAVRAMLGSHVPHAVLLSGPASVGKRALALDLAAALLCTGVSGDVRPCRSCRGCSLVDHGNHPDIHRLEPSGPGGQIRIGDTDHPEPGTVRWLASELALLPVEAGERVAIVGDAQRMNDEAQSALLKTLEEPPARTTLILCVDDEERLLPTVRSRCARIRLGPVGVRGIEGLLASLGLADAPTAARLARLAAGRPGLAVAYASAPEAEAVRGEIVRTLLDLLGEGRAVRLHEAKSLLARARTLAQLLAPEPAASIEEPRGRGRRRTPATPGRASAPDAPPGRPGAVEADAPHAAEAETGGEEPATRLSAAERRRALGTLFDAWRDLARDLALMQAGAPGGVRAVTLVEELEAAARDLPPRAASEALDQIVRAAELLDANVTPELLLDVQLLRWPRRARAA